MKKKPQSISRRKFLRNTALTATAFTIIPRHVLGGNGYIAPSDEITLGFIGLGRKGKSLGTSFVKEVKGVRILAASEVDASKMERFMQTISSNYAEQRGQSDYKGIDGIKDYRSLLERNDIDAVVIATPDHWHGTMGLDALNAGKDVYCEKPLTLTISEGRALVDATRKNERVFQTGSMQRSWNNFRKACELVRNGYIGEIKEVIVSVGGPPKPCDLPTEDPGREIDWNQWIGPAPYRSYHSDLAPPIPEKIWPRWRNYKEYGGGMVTDWGAHMFDIAQWGLGMDHTGPVSFVPANGKDIKHMTLTYANGIKMTHKMLDRGNQVRFIGSEGTIDISRGFLESSIEGLVDIKLKDSDVKLYNSDNHYIDFIDAIKKRSKPICDVEIGHRTASVCNITNIAYELGRPLQWNPDKEKFIKDKEANKMRKRSMREDWKG